MSTRENICLIARASLINSNDDTFACLEIIAIRKCNFEILKLFCCLFCKLILALVSRMKCIRGNCLY